MIWSVTISNAKAKAYSVLCVIGTISLNAQSLTILFKPKQVPFLEVPDSYGNV
jgi:hypothetical protein